MSVTVVPIPGGRLLLHKIQKLVPQYDKCLNSGGEYVENSPVNGVPVPINISLNLVLFVGKTQENLLCGRAT